MATTTNNNIATGVPAIKTCAICSITCTFNCSKCKLIYYCSKEHQTAHWKHHKPRCNPFELQLVVDSSTTNPHLSRKWFVAKYDIAVGQLIFINRPFMIFPKIPSPTEIEPGALKKLLKYKVCMGCCQMMSRVNHCTRCGFPVCSTICQNEPYHDRLECTILSTHRVRWNMITQQPILDCIYNEVLMIRALLLKEVYHDKWKQLLKLRVYGLAREVPKAQLLALIESLREKFKPGRFSNEEISTVYNVILNHLQVDQRMKSCGKLDWMNQHIAQGCLFNMASRHLSTIGPNELKPSSFDQQQQHQNTNTATQVSSGAGGEPIYDNYFDRYFYAVRPIKAGQVLLRPITAIDRIAGTMERRIILHKTTGVWCSCAMCSDPTELNTFLSAIACHNCTPHDPGNRNNDNIGYYLSTSPLNPDAPWKCNSCSQTQPIDTIAQIFGAQDAIMNPGVMKLLENIKNIWGSLCRMNSVALTQAPGRALTSLELSKINSTTKLILSETKSFQATCHAVVGTKLHPNHYVCIIGHLAYLNGLYLYLCLNRKEPSAPSYIWFGNVFGAKIPDSRYTFFTHDEPTDWIELITELKDKATELLQVLKKFSVDHLGSQLGTLYYYIGFASWILLKHKIQGSDTNINKFESFRTDYKQFKVWKTKLERIYRYTSSYGYDHTGIVEWLQKLDSNLNNNSIPSLSREASSEVQQQLELEIKEEEQDMDDDDFGLIELYANFKINSPIRVHKLFLFRFHVVKLWNIFGLT